MNDRHSRRIHGFVITIALSAFLLIASGCSSYGNASKTTDSGVSNGDPRAQATQSEIKGTFAEGVPLVRHASSLMPFFTAEELVGRSRLIVSGEIASHSDSILIRPSQGGEPAFFTDYYLKIDQVFLGEPEYADAKTAQEMVIPIRVEGGRGQLVASYNDSSPGFEEGQRWLLFLYQIADGTNYNAEGPHYYVIGVGMGAWAALDEGFESPFVSSGADAPEVITAEGLMQLTEKVAGPAGPEVSTTGNRIPFSHVMSAEEQRVWEEEAYEKFGEGGSGVGSAS